MSLAERAFSVDLILCRALRSAIEERGDAHLTLAQLADQVGYSVETVAARLKADDVAALLAEEGVTLKVTTSRGRNTQGVVSLSRGERQSRRSGGYRKTGEGKRGAPWEPPGAVAHAWPQAA